jgi:hypothetical protein
MLLTIVYFSSFLYSITSMLQQSVYPKSQRKLNKKTWNTFPFNMEYNAQNPTMRPGRHPDGLICPTGAQTQ